MKVVHEYRGVRFTEKRTNVFQLVVPKRLIRRPDDPELIECLGKGRMIDHINKLLNPR